MARRVIYTLLKQSRHPPVDSMGVARIIGKIDHTLARPPESVHRVQQRPAVGNREESLGFLNEVRDAASIFALTFLSSPGSFCSGNCNPRRCLDEGF